VSSIFRRRLGHIDVLVREAEFPAPPPLSLVGGGAGLGTTGRDRPAVGVGGLVDGGARRDDDRVAYGRVDREGQAHRGRTAVPRGADLLCGAGLLDVVPGEQRGDVQAFLFGDVLVLPLLRGLVRGTRVQHAGQVAVDRRVLGEHLVPVVRRGVL
jgi:hypothetical protein